MSSLLSALEQFRIHLAGRPLLLTGAVAMGLLLLSSMLRHEFPPRRWSDATRVLLVATGIIGLAAYAALALWYASDPHFFDNAEPTIVSVAWAYRMGAPLYHSLDAPERYAHIYGPLAFLTHAAALRLVGPSIQVSKYLGTLAGFASLGFIYAVARRYCLPRRAAVLAGASALLLLAFRHYSFWTRPDALQVLLVAAALYFADGANTRRMQPLLVGIASGALWNLKFTGPLYSLPVLALLAYRAGRRTAVMTVGVALVVTAAPFLLPRVSFVNYLAWIRSSGDTGLLFSTLRANIEWAAYVCAPVLLVRYVVAVPGSSAVAGRLLPSLAVGVCGVALVAAKPGAGPYHLLPFVPIINMLVACTLGQRPVTFARSSASASLLAYLIVLALVAAAQSVQLVTTMVPRRAMAEEDDVREFLQHHSGTVEMAYGRTESLSLLRPILTFHNGSYFIDQPAVREYGLQHVPFPTGTIDALVNCRVDYWLVPRGELPFSGVNAYSAVLLQPLYPQQFRDAFARTQTMVESTRYYDVWRCNGRG